MAAFLERAQPQTASRRGRSAELERALSAASSGIEERFGAYGGRYVPEVLIPALDELSEAWAAARGDAEFRAELDALLRDYVGRPTPLYLADRLSRAGRPPRST